MCTVDPAGGELHTGTQGQFGSLMPGKDQVGVGGGIKEPTRGAGRGVESVRTA